MSYTGLKWHKFKFILHPTEFESIFCDLEYFIAITNTWVEIDYQIEDKTSIFEQYQSYYTKIISGIEGKGGLYTHLTDDPEFIRYETFEVEQDHQIKSFKRAIQVEPVINVSPFSLMFDYKENLCINLFEPKLNIGLQLSYPKEILQNNTIVKTENLSTYKLYLELIKRIKKLAHKAKAIRNGVTSSPDFWISEKCSIEINRNFGLKENKINLV